MDAKDIRNLQEAYMEVVENQQLDEVSDKRVAAVGRKREKNVDTAFNKYLASKISSHDLATTVGKASRSKLLSDRRARRKTNEQTDIYDIILSHLLDEGYAETPEAAEAIMVNMSEEWRDGIIGESRWGSRGGYREPIGQSDSRRLGRDPRYGSLSDSDQAAAKKREDSAAEAAKRRLRRNLECEGDDSNYSADKTKNPKKLRKQKAMGELGEQYIDEAEGSYGQTPKARKAFGDLANKRRATPATGFSKKGEKTTKVKSAQKHFDRTGNPDAGNRGKKSTKPSFHSGARKGMTQSDRDHSRGEAEYGHTGYDPDFDGGPSGPGGKPKGKKLERQRKTGVSAD